MVYPGLGGRENHLQSGNGFYLVELGDGWSKVQQWFRRVRALPAVEI